MRPGLEPTSATALRPDLGLVIFRVFLGTVLVYGTQDNVFGAERMHEFAGFLEQNGFPLPLASAYLSAWAQFVAGILIVLGVFTRVAALVMVINFVVAIAMVHAGLPFDANIAPLAMLFGSLMLVLTGPGKYRLGGAAARARAQ
jgi:putative oxidoreductase